MRERPGKQPGGQGEGLVDSDTSTRSQSDFVMERFGNLQDADRSFDIEYWQRQGDAAIYRAAWELVEFYHRDQGMGPDELRLQRSIESFQRT
jgi:hypothetical protein